MLFESNNWTLPTTLEVIKPAGEAFQKKLKEAGWSSNEIFGLHLGFHEALVNAIVHGNLGINDIKQEQDLEDLVQEELKKNPAKKNKKVHVVLSITRDRVFVKIIDEGVGFQSEEIPESMPPVGREETSGRGMVLMGKYFDSAYYIENQSGIGGTTVLEKEKLE